MMDRFDIKLKELKLSGNYRRIKTPAEINELSSKIDLSSNDYLGLSQNTNLVKEFLDSNNCWEFSSVASRLLSLKQKEFYGLENTLSSLYGKEAIIFNSGYHANTGIISSLGSSKTLFIADKLIHASIIDGLFLSNSIFKRFRHNDYNHLESIIEQEINNYETIIIISESIFSMDGDCCDLERLVNIKKKHNNILLYIDEAHAFGVRGNKGLGLCEEKNKIEDIDFIIGTLGKAAASCGAFVITSTKFKEYLINNARSLIFSTAIPPINCAWSNFIINKIVNMKQERHNLQLISQMLYTFINSVNENIFSESQIIPLVVGGNEKTIELSKKLEALGFIALPIRTPTVPAGAERIRFSLNATLATHDISDLITAIKSII
ncbi:MAG: aminotransferase class I/II-fold pyridoxal phosphate-dependent enzyme [Muribaculaceae bacterium]|nr:aminotransferase class I/II-fold pyridoxal phosphate-dependent enzyme [Muribaculaceae bacterium]